MDGGEVQLGMNMTMDESEAGMGYGPIRKSLIPKDSNMVAVPGYGPADQSDLYMR